MDIIGQMTINLREITLSSSKRDKLPLENYFPPNFIIHEYNATENRLTKTTTLDADLKEWLRDRANHKFIFQCLLCCQEMTFHTAFCHGDWPPKSHLLTAKHEKNVRQSGCVVGVLFLSSRKFVLCKKTVFNSGDVFRQTKSIKRRENAIVSSLIQNQVFCSNYSMYTFDCQTKTLKEMEFKIDLVRFMREEVRPLFTFHCLTCDGKAESYTVVINHLTGRKHIKKLGGKKGVIIAIKDFNIFVACEFENITSLLFLNHLNSYLEEIIIASEGSLVISGRHSNDGKTAPIEGEVKVNVEPIKFPDGETRNQSIKIKTRYNNAITGLIDEDDICNHLSNSGGTRQNNVKIYEYSTKNLEADYIDSNLLAFLYNGYKIWCTRCQIGISSLTILQSHLCSTEHAKKFRGHEQTGFMCHSCNIFFIELKGEKFDHTHSSQENKRVIKKLIEQNVYSIEFSTPLMKIVTKTFINMLSNSNEDFKFCCLACFDIAKQNLMYLGHHETADCHKKLPKKCLFSYCEYCNVLYIDKELSQISMQFKLHYASHLSAKNAVLQYSVHDLNGKKTEMRIDNFSASLKNIMLLNITEKPLSCQKLSVRYSKSFIQFTHPGISTKDFVESENWDNIDLYKYLEIYTSITGNKVEQFECLMCKHKTNAKSVIIDHLFISEHQKNTQRMKTIFVKICDICDLMMISVNLVDLQNHFFTSHLPMLRRKTALPSMFAAPSGLNEFMNLSKTSFSNIIKNHVNEMRLTFTNRKRIIKMITDDVLELLSKKFPDVSVTFYGSSISGLALTNSDFDICLNTGNEHLEEVHDLFKTENIYFKLIVCISESSVPIIRVAHKASGALCDINLEDCKLKPHVAKLIKIYYEMDERVLWLLAAVRYWANSTNIKSTNMFSSHAITWLVLFYLMQPDVRIIPNVLYVVKVCGSLDDLRDRDFVLDWPKHEISMEKTWFDLLEGFFNYYCHLKFSEYKMFPLNGRVIPSKIGTSDVEERPMYMQDPLNKERNILFNATKEKSEKLASSCYFSLHSLWRLDDQ